MEGQQYLHTNVAPARRVVVTVSCRTVKTWVELLSPPYPLPPTPSQQPGSQWGQGHREGGGKGGRYRSEIGRQKKKNAAGGEGLGEVE